MTSHLHPLVRVSGRQDPDAEHFKHAGLVEHSDAVDREENDTGQDYLVRRHAGHLADHVLPLEILHLIERTALTLLSYPGA